MKLVKGEKKLASHGSLVLTNKRLIQKSSSVRRKKTKEIPLKKIDSIDFMRKTNRKAIVIGLVLLFIGVPTGILSLVGLALMI